MRGYYMLAKQKMEAQWGEETSAPKKGTNQQSQAFQENLILERLKKS